MTDAGIIDEWTINRRERVRVSVESFKGVDLIIKFLPQLTEAMVKACSLASERQLISPPAGGNWRGETVKSPRGESAAP